MDRYKSEGDPVVVGPAVIQGIEAARATGLTNMFDRLEVARIAHTLGHYAAWAWIEANPTAYAEGIFRGFEAWDFWDAHFKPGGPLISEDNAEWLHSMSWGGLPEDGDDFMEYMGWYALPKAEQRETAEAFMEYPRARHMPTAVKDHLVALGLLGGGGHPRGEEASDGRE